MDVFEPAGNRFYTGRRVAVAGLVRDTRERSRRMQFGSDDEQVTRMAIAKPASNLRARAAGFGDA